MGALNLCSHEVDSTTKALQGRDLAGRRPEFRRLNSRMATLKHNFEHNGICIQVDDDGFMEEPELWNEQVALALAFTEGVEELTEDHWKVVNYLRDYYLRFGVAPMIRKLCKETKFSLKEIYELFPSGPAKGACKVAGLHKPTGCV